jgi:type IV pilus assembly protein PilW
MIGSGRRQRGVSLTELMIAITLGLLVTTGVIALFSSNSSMRNEIERTGRRLENGQYALRTITHDLANAGYYAEYDPTVQPRLPMPVGKPDPCVTTPADLVDALPRRDGR